MNLSAKLLMNAAYGRFGMDDDFTFTHIMSKKDYINFEKQDGATDSIIDVVEIGDNYLVQIKNPKVKLKTDLDNGSENHNVNIAIASAVSAYARVHMSQFKNNKYKLYYSDTDSIFIDRPLDDSVISNTELGKMKLEGIYEKAIFLAPKVYILQLENNNFEIKIKGVTKKAIIDNNINLSLFESLLHKDYLSEIKQDKWYRSLTNSNITIKDQIYTLKVTENKRELVYNYNNKLIDTKSFILPIDNKTNL